MNLYLRKDGRCELKTQNGKNFDVKRLFLYVLARTKEQYIERMQVICQRNRPHGTCLLSMADLFSEWYRSILHRLKESMAANYTMTSNCHFQIVVMITSNNYIRHILKHS